MSNTVRQRIVEQIVENLTNIVKESNVIASSSNTGAVMPTIASSGTYSGTTPLKIKMEATAINKITFTDITNGGSPSEITIVSGTPIVITGTGISVTFTYSSFTIGDIWYLRMNKSTHTIKKVVPWYATSDKIPMPHILVYDLDERKVSMPNERYDCTLIINLILRYKEVNRLNNEINNMVGDIENEFNRDIHLIDASGAVLCYNLWVDGSEILVSEGSEEIIGANIQCTVKYRHAFTDTRTTKH